MAVVQSSEVERVAELARLEFSAEEMEQIRLDLEDILEYVQILSEVDTTGVEPTTQVCTLVNRFREDVAHSSLDIEEVLANAPDVRDRFFSTPKVIPSSEGRDDLETTTPDDCS